jgi:hypothetical protein
VQTAAAESRILDADAAEVTAALVKHQILEQAASAVHQSKGTMRGSMTFLDTAEQRSFGEIGWMPGPR